MELTKEDVDVYLYSYLRPRFRKIIKRNYYLAYSGGRDSPFLYWFIKNILHDQDIKIVAVNTMLEHQEIRERMEKNADVILFPIMKHKYIKEKYGIPCFTKQQDEYIYRYQKGSRAKSTLDFINGEGSYTVKFKMSKKPRELLLTNKLHKVSNKCCNFLKKEPLKKYEKENNKFPIIGLRNSEGIMRNKFKTCLQKNNNFMPIFDLTDEMLEAIEYYYHIEVPEIYKYLKRTGCMGCPYGRNTEMELSFINEAQKNFVIDYFKESYDVKEINYN